ncbi:hypothetical protein BC831DRAFT_548206 [Entophlyctis helioformis]|nr:hypothetical protein BC831DRAFT_548206 [Entophlyctis helioformis]
MLDIGAGRQRGAASSRPSAITPQPGTPSSPHSLTDTLACNGDHGNEQMHHSTRAKARNRSGTEDDNDNNDNNNNHNDNNNDNNKGGTPRKSRAAKTSTGTEAGRRQRRLLRHNLKLPSDFKKHFLHPYDAHLRKLLDETANADPAALLGEREMQRLMKHAPHGVGWTIWITTELRDVFMARKAALGPKARHSQLINVMIAIMAKRYPELVPSRFNASRSNATIGSVASIGIRLRLRLRIRLRPSSICTALPDNISA